MRDICKVIDEIIKNVPVVTKTGPFIASLKQIQLDVKYTAPEDMRCRWDMLAYIFNTYVPFPAIHQWHETVVKIFTEKEAALKASASTAGQQPAECNAESGAAPDPAGSVDSSRPAGA